MRDAILNIVFPSSLRQHDDDIYLKYLLTDISRGESNLHQQRRHVRIIGLWLDEEKISLSSRCDTEESYFASQFHNLQDYIDDNWNLPEKEIILNFLTNKQHKIEHIIVSRDLHKIKELSSQPTVSCGNALSDKYRVFRHGSYVWHESLAEFVRFYNVRPPQFFVDYILAIKEKIITSANNN